MKTILSLICMLGFATILSAQRAGTLDSSFGLNGIVLTDFGTRNQFNCTKGFLQSDGKIIATGTYNTGGYFSFSAIRYFPNGSYDTTFGNSGQAIIKFNFDFIQATSSAIQQDGKIVIVGYGYNFAAKPIYHGLIARLNADGSIDNSFGNNGIVTNSYTKDVIFNGIIIQSNNEIVAAGTSSGFDALTSRYLPNGTADSTFGDNGNTTYRAGAASCLIQQNDGKIVIGGWTRTSSPNGNFLLVRYLNSGALDTSFGSGGTVITDYGTYGDQVFALAVQDDNKIIATGGTGLNNDGKHVYMQLRDIRQMVV